MVRTSVKSKSKVWSIRYYLCRDDYVLGRLPNTLHQELLAKTVALPELFNSKQKVLEALIGKTDGRQVLLDARGSIYSFDGAGRLDVHPTAEFMTHLAEMGRRKSIQGKVIDARSIFRKRQWSAQETWKPNQQMRRIVRDNLSPGTKKILVIKVAAVKLKA